MSDETGNRPTRRKFLEGLGVSAATIAATGGISGLQAGASGNSAEASSGKASSPSDKKPGVRQEIDLSGPWGFQVDFRNDVQNQIDSMDEGEKLSYFSPDFPSKNWSEVSIPRAFDDCAPGMYKFRGTCWYSRRFEAPESMRGRRVVVHFEGVNYNSSVWVNGKLVGQNEDAFLPFEFPVDEVLRFGEHNLIVVRVDNYRGPAQLPTTEYWQGQGGILREVQLVATDLARLVHVGITAAPEDGKGKFALRALVSNERAQPANLFLRVKILNSAGRPVANFTGSPLVAEAGRETELSAAGDVEHVAAWSPEQPTLYTARVDLLAEGKLIDQQQTQFGFRRVEARDGKLLLNGKPVFLMGFDRHEDSPRTGMAVDLENSRQDFQTIKEAGGNFVRFCHYPHHPGELHICDELGLMVLAEIPLCAWGVGEYPLAGRGWNPSEATAIQHNAERHLRKMILRDLNHPSIIFWSVSNESEEQHPEINQANNRLIQLGREIDPTRMMTHVSDRWPSEKDVKYFEFDDVICVNGYPWFHHEPGDNSWLEKSAKWWREQLAQLHDRNPDKPIVITEFGQASIQGVNGPFGEDTQALAAEAEFKAMTAPYVFGSTLWCYAKHPWPPGLGFGDILFDESPWGFVSRDRKTKMKGFAVVSRMFKQRAELLKRSESS